MLNETASEIERLKQRLQQWTTVEEFDEAVTAYFKSERSKEDIANYRSKRGSMKKLRDEITPVHRHVMFTQKQGEIRFALNDDIPDVWFRENSSASSCGMEVTVALSREQHYLGRELNEKGVGRGFIGIQDDAPIEDFDKKLNRNRSAYSSQQVLKTVEVAINRCFLKKNNKKYSGHDLLVEAPLGLIPKERWSQIDLGLRRAAATLPFREVHVIGNRDGGLFGFQLK